MGLFSGEDVYTVSISTTQAIDPVPKCSLLSDLAFKGEKSSADVIKAYALKNPARQLKSYRKKVEAIYPLGLPLVTLQYLNSKDTALEAYINNIYTPNFPCTVTLSYKGDMSATAYPYYYLMTDPLYDIETCTYEVATGKIGDFQSISANIIDPNIWDITFKYLDIQTTERTTTVVTALGVDPTTVDVTTTITDNLYRNRGLASETLLSTTPISNTTVNEVHTTQIIGTTSNTVVTSIIDLSIVRVITPPNPTGTAIFFDPFYVCDVLLSNGVNSAIAFPVADVGVLWIPQPSDVPLDYTGMVPIIALREDKVDINNPINDGTPELINTKKVLKKIGIKLDKFMLQLREGVDTAPANGGSVYDTNIEGIYLMFALNIHDTTPANVEALYNLFDIIEPLANVTKAAYEAETLDRRHNNPYDTIKIEMSKFNITLKYNYIDKQVLLPLTNLAQSVQDSLVNVGDYTRIITLSPAIDITALGSSRMQDSAAGLRFIGMYSKNLCQNTIEFILKTSTTEYTSIFVHGLNAVQEIPRSTGSELLMASTLDLVADSATPYLPNSVEYLAQKNFVIPIPLDLLQYARFIEKEPLVQGSLNVVTYSNSMQHLKWYQTSAFAMFVQFVASVISIYTMDFSGSLIALAKAFAIRFLVSTAISIAVGIVLGDTESPLLIFAAAIAATYAASYILDPAAMAEATLGDLLLASVDQFSTLTSKQMGKAFGALQKEFDILKDDMVAHYTDMYDYTSNLKDYSNLTTSVIDSIGGEGYNDTTRTMSPSAYYATRLQTNLADLMVNYSSTYVDFTYYNGTALDKNFYLEHHEQENTNGKINSI